MTATARLASAQTNVSQTEHSVIVTVGSAQIEAAAVTPGAFRLSVSYDGKPKPHQSIFLTDAVNSQPAVQGKVVREGKLVGVATATGELLIDPTDGAWTLHDSKGGVIIPPSKIGEEKKDDKGKPRVFLDVEWKKGKPPTFYGSGNGVVSLVQTQGISRVGNGIAVEPRYWSDSGYLALAVGSDDNVPARWATPEGKDHVTWRFDGSSADLYLMPAATLYDAATAYAGLSGAPAVPPRWTFGYLQCRWGWKDRAYIEDTLKQFNDRKLPVDAFIFDFEWYTTEPDYKLPPEGQTNFVDFGWNPALFPDPVKQLADYQAQGIRMMGIRKPRLGNAETLQMIREKGWGMPHTEGHEAFDARDINFQNPDVRAWYAQQTGKLLDAGVAGWWDDEGEVTFTTYYYWNQAQSDAMAIFRPGARSWTITRAFQPGLQRFAAATWTGDIKANWGELEKTPTHLLNWSLAGMSYGTCDIGGFKGETNPELLTRWMEAGAFFPVMRSHSRHENTPHFPWLYGPDAEAAIRKALDIRYRLIPMYYSLAHEAYRTGAPLMRPLLMEFPNDPKVANLSSQWLIGRGLMAAPLLQEGGKRSVYLPDDKWYLFDGNTKVAGNRSVDLTVALDEIPVYVRAGTILPLAPILLHTDQLPGGPLELQVYPGKNASFTLVEDDGLTTAYAKGQVRRTTFTWDDARRHLSWQIEGPYAGKDIFTSMKVKVFDSKLKLVDGSLAASGALDIPN